MGANTTLFTLCQRKFRSLYKLPSDPFLYCPTLQLLLLILCPSGGNTRDVTAKQRDGSLLKP
jgi:hypothetical protein